MGVHVGVEVDPGVCCEGAKMALVHQAFLICGQDKLVLATFFYFHISIYCISIADYAGRISFGIVENTVVQNLKINKRVDILTYYSNDGGKITFSPLIFAKTSDPKKS